MDALVIVNANVVIGCAGYCVWSNLENRDAWYFGPSKHFECVLRLSRRPHPERLAKYALVARLRSQEQQQSQEATIQMFVPVRKAKDQIISHVQVYLKKQPGGWAGADHHLHIMRNDGKSGK